MGALGVAGYAAAAAWILTRAGKLSNSAFSAVVGPAAFLLFFTTSAAAVGALVFGKPIFLYLAGEKREAIATFLATIAILLFIFSFVLLFLI